MGRSRSYPPPSPIRDNAVTRTTVKKAPIRRGRGDRKSGSRRHRKVGTRNRENVSI